MEGRLGLMRGRPLGRLVVMGEGNEGIAGPSRNQRGVVEVRHSCVTVLASLWVLI